MNKKSTWDSVCIVSKFCCIPAWIGPSAAAGPSGAYLVNCLECSSDISFSLCTNTAFLDLQTGTRCFIFWLFFLAQQISHIQLRILLDTLLKGRYTLIDSSITDRFVCMCFCYNIYFDFCYKVTCAGCSLCIDSHEEKRKLGNIIYTLPLFPYLNKTYDFVLLS